MNLCWISLGKIAAVFQEPLKLLLLPLLAQDSLLLSLWELVSGFTSHISGSPWRLIFLVGPSFVKLSGLAACIILHQLGKCTKTIRFRRWSLDPQPYVQVDEIKKKDHQTRKFDAHCARDQRKSLTWACSRSLNVTSPNPKKATRTATATATKNIQQTTNNPKASKQANK